MSNEPAGNGRRILATDLDGTLIPLDQQNEVDLQTLARQLERNGVRLIFVTGRHFESVSNAIEQFQLPLPEWVICDVGTSLFKRQAAGNFEPVEGYQQHQRQIVAAMPIPELRQRLHSLQGLRIQEEEKQGPFKLSFYANAARLDDLVSRIQQQLDETKAPYTIIHSVDPFNGDGLIDLLPRGVSKAHALAWWAEDQRVSPDALVFAGDSGNDLAALTSGYRCIVVGNADRQLAKRVYDLHRESGWENRLHLAHSKATSGVLEGCRWFEVVDSADSSAPLARLGSTPMSHNQTHFRVWAPRRHTVAVELQPGAVELQPGAVRTRQALQRSEHGYFSGTLTNAKPGALYQYVLDGGEPRPDPTSRYQPDGVHGASQIVDPAAFPWSDQSWPGVPKRELIIYELHVGTFTQDGTFRSAIERLPQLVDLGITAIEVMPVAQSPGRWNWGYDAVDLFAVRNTYGEPEDFKAFVDACHAVGIGVVLDVVYNHVGPEGNYLAEFGPYFSRQHRTPWGEAFNFDGRHSPQVRKFVVENAIYWLDEYHLDGLRLDAVHFMRDDSDRTILDEIREAVSKYAATADRLVHLIAEANVFDQELLASTQDRPAYDAIWCDCMMHSIYSHAVPELQLAHREYRGAGDLAEALRHGYLYSFVDCKPVRVSRRQHDKSQPRENARDIASFVTALQTHDGVGNHPHGKRLHHLTSIAFQKAAAAITLLYPSIPLLFMGEESATDAPFPFFADFGDTQLRKAVDEGRAREYPQHVWQGALSPSEARAFFSAKYPDASHCDADMVVWYRALIELRKQGVAEGWLSAAGMSSDYDSDLDVFSLRFAGVEGDVILVQARLTSANRGHVKPVGVTADGDLLLSSEPQVETSRGQVMLQANHAVITRRYVAKSKAAQPE